MLAEQRLTAELVFSTGDVMGLVASLDADRDGAVAEAELRGAKDAVLRAVADRIEVRADGAPCRRTRASATLEQEDGLAVHAELECGAPPSRVEVECRFVEDLARGHRHLAALTAGSATSTDLLSSARRSLDVAVPADGAAAARGAAAAQERAPGASAYFLLGIEHILHGYDHLVFLLGLLLVGGRFRSLLLVVSAFTVAHSITLGLAVLGVWAPSPRFVEPAIALSIAYVGVENYFVKDAERRFRVTFPFGLVHGFGFAGALQEIAVPRGDVPVALLCFNLGVEVGQLAVVALALPLVLAARKRAWFRNAGVKAVSAGVVVAGVAWFFLRVSGLEPS